MSAHAFASVADLAARIRTRDLSPVALVDELLARADRCRVLNAFITVTTEVARAQAAEAERESKAGYDIVSKQAAPSVSWLKSAREDLAAAYDALHRPEEAARFRVEAARVAKAAASR